MVNIGSLHAFIGTLKILIGVIEKRRIGEPAYGSGQMVRELQKHCAHVHSFG